MLKLSKEVVSMLHQDALGTYPDECCGFLLGSELENIREVVEIRIVDNAKEGDKRRRFEISALDYIQAENYADANNLSLIGVYHSHPNHPSIPSEHDRLAAQPFFSYLIVAVKPNEVVSIQSWILNDDFHFEEESVQIEQ